MDINEKNLKIAEDMLENHIEACDYINALTLCNDILINFPENEKATFYYGYLSIVPKHFNLLKTFSLVEKNFNKTIKLLQNSSDIDEEKKERYENYIKKIIKVLLDCKNKFYQKVYPDNTGRPDFSTEHMYNAFDLYTESILGFVDRFWSTHLTTPLYSISTTKLSNFKKDVLGSLEWPIAVLGNNLLYRDNDLEPVYKYFTLYDFFNAKRMEWFSSTYPDKCQTWEKIEHIFLDYKKEVDAYFQKVAIEEKRFKMELQKASFFSKNKIQKEINEYEETINDFLKKVNLMVEEYVIKRINGGWVKGVAYNSVDLVNPILANYKESRRKELEDQYRKEYEDYLNLSTNERYNAIYKIF